MSEGYLSQDEIDALLQGTEEITDSTTVSSAGPLDTSEIDLFKSVMQGTVESQSSNISMVTGKSVIIGAPNVEVKSKQQMLAELMNDVIEVKIDFTDGLVGEHSFLLDPDIAKKLAGFIMGQKDVDLNEAALSGVAEAISNIVGTIATTLGNQINQTVMISPAQCNKVKKGKVKLPAGDSVVKVQYPISIEGEKPAVLIELFALSSVKEVVARSTGSGMATGQPALAGSKMGSKGDTMAKGMSNSGGGDSVQGGDQSILEGLNSMMSTPNVQSVQFPNLQSSQSSQEQSNIGLLMDVYMEMTVELGRTKKLIRDILGIGEGTIIELDKLAGEPVDILVNHKLIAKGEVVVIDENFGVRVTEIVSPLERMADLK
jgi:flagellar motor switch protein FliN/FliY